MAQLNVYVTDELEEKIKREAKRRGASVSSIVSEAIIEKLEPETWSSDFLDLLKSEPVDFPVPLDLPLQTRISLDD